jgi:malonyl CoA-acyl carrier protein transacylase
MEGESKEKVKQKGKAGRKPKYDYHSKEFLDLIEKLAEKTMTDKEIAESIGLAQTVFAGKKARNAELRETLARARRKINLAVRATFLNAALGKVVTKSKVTRSIILPDGTESDKKVVEETETQLPPSTRSLSSWLSMHDPDWDETQKIDVTSGGSKIIPPKLNIAITYNKKEDCELQGKRSESKD